MKVAVVITLILGALGCTGTDSADHDENLDPRCQSICAIEEPYLEGAFDICSETSAELCRFECSARIELASDICALCLLEDAVFGDDDGGISLDPCNAGSCTINGRGGSCTYPQDDQTAEENCLRQVHPRTEVSCDTEFAPVESCATFCDS